jgi:hypothetical protein
MTENPVDDLTELADQLDEEVAEYRQPNEFKEISLVIDNENNANPTLIVHVDREDAASLADRIEDFLQEHGARTERERHSETDMRVLATLN